MDIIDGVLVEKGYYDPDGGNFTCASRTPPGLGTSLVRTYHMMVMSFHSTILFQLPIIIVKN